MGNMEDGSVMWFTFWPKIAKQPFQYVIEYCHKEEGNDRCLGVRHRYVYTNDQRKIEQLLFDLQISIHDELITPVLSRKIFFIFDFWKRNLFEGCVFRPRPSKVFFILEKFIFSFLIQFKRVLHFATYLIRH